MEVQVDGPAPRTPHRRRGMTRRSAIAFVSAAAAALALPALPARAQSRTVECAADLVVS